jgi:uroporphyrinogen-III decarboxylase
VGLFEGPFTVTCRVIEVEQIMRMIFKNRLVMEPLLARVNEILIAFSKALIESGVK